MAHSTACPSLVPVSDTGTRSRGALYRRSRKNKQKQIEKQILELKQHTGKESKADGGETGEAEGQTPPPPGGSGSAWEGLAHQRPGMGMGDRVCRKEGVGQGVGELPSESEEEPAGRKS